MQKIEFSGHGIVALNLFRPFRTVEDTEACGRLLNG